jgi:phage shock protein A
MFKFFITLLRGAEAAATQQLADHNALAILDQQVRDSGLALEQAKKALALAMARQQQEAERLKACEARIADLEARVSAAIRGGQDDLAEEGAEAIAALEADRGAALEARKMFETEMARLRGFVAQAEHQLAALDRGRRLARAAEAVRVMRRGRVEPASPWLCTISEAEATLKRLRERQAEMQAAEAALDSLDSLKNPETVADKLAARGFGPKTRTDAADVLARLRARMAQGAAGAAA